MQALLSRPPGGSSHAYVHLDAPGLKRRPGKAQQVCLRALVVAMGVTNDDRRELRQIRFPSGTRLARLGGNWGAQRIIIVLLGHNEGWDGSWSRQPFRF